MTVNAAKPSPKCCNVAPSTVQQMNSTTQSNT